MERLKSEVRNLELDCQRMCQELDTAGTNSVRPRSTATTPSTPRATPTSPNGPAQPHLPPPSVEEEEEEDESGGWNCHRCTFYNHPALSKCEECESPRSFPSVTASHGQLTKKKNSFFGICFDSKFLIGGFGLLFLAFDGRKKIQRWRLLTRFSIVAFVVFPFFIFPSFGGCVFLTGFLF